MKAEAPKKKRAGGLAKVIQITMGDLGDRIDDATDLGFESGVDYATKLMRAEIADQLRDELVDPDCPLCRSRRDLESLELELTRTRQELQRVKARAKGWAIRSGRRAYVPRIKTPQE